MTLKTFISKLNWRQLLIHFIAAWFFIHAFKTFCYLYDTKLVDVVRHSPNSQELKKTLNNNEPMAENFMSFLFWQTVSGTMGLVIAFIISLTISFKRHWFWMNALLLLL